MKCKLEVSSSSFFFFFFRKQYPLVNLSHEPIVTELGKEKNEIDCKDRLSKVLEECQRRYSGYIFALYADNVFKEENISLDHQYDRKNKNNLTQMLTLQGI